jgi:hypothetical protein
MADADPLPPRRFKRSSAAISPVKSTGTTTPGRGRPIKKARFSEPIPQTGTTGLTPAVGKAGLKTPKRRLSTPATTRFQDHDEVQYTPFTEQLSARTTRQIRRHGLSTIQNEFYADKYSKAKLQRELDQKNEEIKRLKAENEALEQRQATDELAASQSRINHLEAEVTKLTQTFHDDDSGVGSSSPQFDDDFLIFEDDTANDGNQDDDDATVDLELETARQAKQSFFRSSQSFSNKVVSFQDSPDKFAASRKTPEPPHTNPQDLLRELNAAVNRAEEAELALQAMTTEIAELGFPTVNTSDTSILAGIRSHFHAMRLALERTLPGESTLSLNDAATLMPEMLSKLSHLSSTIRERNIELRSMRDQQRTLKGNFDHALLATEKASRRIKDLENTIEQNAEDMLHQRMRAQQAEHDTAEIEKNNRSLISAIEKYRLEVTRLESLVEKVEAEQAMRLQEVRTATSQQVSDMEAKVSAETHGRRAAEDSAIERLHKINALESALSKTRENSDTIQSQLDTISKSFNSTSATHEAEVKDLTSRITSLSSALTTAQSQIDHLIRDRKALETLYREEVDRSSTYAQSTYDLQLRLTTQAYEDKKRYIRASKVKLANWELQSEVDEDLPSDPVLPVDGAPMTPSSMVRFSEFSEISSSPPQRSSSSSDVEDGDEESAIDSDVRGTHLAPLNDIATAEDDGHDHIEGRVELTRGKKHRRNSSSSLPATSPLLRGGGIDATRGILKKKPRRRYDSGIGMDSSDGVGLSDVDEGMETEVREAEVMV